MKQVASGEWEEVVQARLVRWVLGNPFRRVTFDPAWRTAALINLAKSLYDEQAFNRRVELAEKLPGAGCRPEEKLSHLHAAKPHCRGCWALDLILNTNQN
ncbi:hypothetical protein KIH39_08470 [Telmatocola sphagniphila]|uniref:Uncharacterized protein n=1 Tax=Telmatocola sphagniphila TaxID=1123043 RepID=A0A8E6EZX2_9BACT|nr:hypothetical protein [Telmatocola sphagniphila]QVL33926.1 hypothetical protein KIH39_08470 [Telmatocola sphagniphila]